MTPSDYTGLTLLSLLLLGYVIASWGPAFARGMASVLDLFPEVDMDHCGSLEDDWRAVGNDLRKVMEREG